MAMMQIDHNVSMEGFRDAFNTKPPRTFEIKQNRKSFHISAKAEFDPNKGFITFVYGEQRTPKTDQDLKKLFFKESKVDPDLDYWIKNGNLMVIRTKGDRDTNILVISKKWQSENLDDPIVYGLPEKNVILGKENFIDTARGIPTTTVIQLPKEIQDMVTSLNLNVELIKEDLKKGQLLDIDDLKEYINKGLINPNQLSSLSSELDRLFTRKNGINKDTYLLYKNVIEQEHRGKISTSDNNKTILRKTPIKRNIAIPKKTITSS